MAVTAGRPGAAGGQLEQMTWRGQWVVPLVRLPRIKISRHLLAAAAGILHQQWQTGAGTVRTCVSDE